MIRHLILFIVGIAIGILVIWGLNAYSKYKKEVPVYPATTGQDVNVEPTGYYLIRKHFKFDAAHFLANHPGKCRTMHGHTWKGYVQLQAKELSGGMVVDFADLKGAMSGVVDSMDHKVINDVVTMARPTSELLAKHIFDEVKKAIPLHFDAITAARIRIVSVCVQETDGSEAIYHE